MTASLVPTTEGKLMTRECFDTIGQHASSIPAAAGMVAGYVLPSPFAWTDTEWDRFPDAAHVRITVHGTLPDWRHASVVDVETGAFTPADARWFVLAREAYRPGSATGYCNLSTLPAVRMACRGLSYHLWLAVRWGKAPASLEEVAQAVRADLGGLVAVQWRDAGAFDQSVVF